MKITSFDIFNTLIGRDLMGRGPIGPILAVKAQQRFSGELPAPFAQNLQAIRNEAQARAHALTEHAEIRLEEIYGAIAARYPEIDRTVLQKIQDLEEDLEVELCYGITENIERVLGLLEGGERLVLVCGMYLPEAAIRRMLEKVEPRLNSLPLYLSSEIRLRKIDGKLFTYLAEKEGVTPREIQHFGDDRQSDYTMAKSMGLSPALYQASHTNEIERAYDNEKTGMTGSVYISASQKARLTQSKGGSPASFLLGASYTAPLFYGFVQWFLERIAATGIKDVYFLARDGYILIEIAKRLQARIAPKARLHYLYISRQSALFPSLTKVTNQSLDWVFEEMDNIITLDRAAKRLHCGSADLGALLPEAIRPTTEQRLNEDQIRTLREEILKNRTFRERIEAKAAKARLVLAAYLKQSGIDESSKVALVDIGWKSSIQDSIYRTLSDEQQSLRLEGFYYGCSHFSHLTSSRNRKHAYQITPSNSPGLGAILELLLMAPHGTTMGYIEDDTGSFSPDLKAYTGPDHNWDIEGYFEGIHAFTETLIEMQSAHPEIELYPQAVSNMLLELLKVPPAILAKTLGDLPYCGDQEESNLRAMAPAFSFADACKFLLVSERARSRMTQWFEASKRRSALLPRLILGLDPRELIHHAVRGLVTGDAQRQKFRNLRKRLRF